MDSNRYMQKVCYTPNFIPNWHSLNAHDVLNILLCVLCFLFSCRFVLESCSQAKNIEICSLYSYISLVRFFVSLVWICPLERLGRKTVVDFDYVIFSSLHLHPIWCWQCQLAGPSLRKFAFFPFLLSLSDSHSGCVYIETMRGGNIIWIYPYSHYLKT